MWWYLMPCIFPGFLQIDVCGHLPRLHVAPVTEDVLSRCCRDFPAGLWTPQCRGTALCQIFTRPLPRPSTKRLIKRDTLCTAAGGPRCAPWQLDRKESVESPPRCQEDPRCNLHSPAGKWSFGVAAGSDASRLGPIRPRTSLPGVFTVGDSTDRLKLLHFHPSHVSAACTLVLRSPSLA